MNVKAKNCITIGYCCVPVHKQKDGFSAENNYCKVLIEHSCLNNLKINIVSRETSAINFSIYLIKMLRHCCKFYKKLMVNRK